MRRLARVSKPEKEIPFRGGLDTVTPQRYVDPGRCRSASNVYEDLNNGYTTTMRYERFDGQTAPSDAVYAVLNCSTILNATVGSSITGSVSAATAEVIAIDPDYLVITKIVGNFQAETVMVGALVAAEATGIQIVSGAETSKLDAEYKALAADVYRADILAVPGADEVRGVFRYNDVTYAFRDTVGNTACKLHKSTASGWSEVDLGGYLDFTAGGTYVPQVGDTIDDGTETAVIGKIMELTSGDWSTSDAAGRMWVHSKSGNFTPGAIDIGANTGVFTIAADIQETTLAAGGNYEFKIGNFTGSSATRYVYGCDGANKGFEFDGTQYVEITTGMTVDTPRHLFIHQFHLFFTFDASLQFSEAGDPHDWVGTVVVGPGEIALGDTITGLASLPGESTTAAMAVYSRNSFHVLYGVSPSFQLVEYKQGMGAIEWTTQLIESVFVFDDRGIVDIRAAQTFGNFQDASASDHVRDYLDQYKGNVKASCVLKDKNLYCIFFGDKTAVYCTVKGGRIASIMPQTFPHQVERIFSTEDSDGEVVTFFGDTDGYVYQLDRGLAFDGEDLEWNLSLIYNHLGSPDTIKRFRRASFELDGLGYSEFYFTYALGYNSALISQPVEQLEESGLQSSSAKWDTVYWDQFYWDSIEIAPIAINLYGSAENISIVLRGKSNRDTQVRFSGVRIQYTPLRDS